MLLLLLISLWFVFKLIYLKGRMTVREGRAETQSIVLLPVAPQKATTSRTELGRSQDPGNPLGSPMWVVGVPGT